VFEKESASRRFWKVGTKRNFGGISSTVFFGFSAVAIIQAIGRKKMIAVVQQVIVSVIFVARSLLGFMMFLLMQIPLLSFEH
jgi:hypothetical protein